MSLRVKVQHEVHFLTGEEITVLSKKTPFRVVSYFVLYARDMYLFHIIIFIVLLGY